MTISRHEPSFSICFDDAPTLRGFQIGELAGGAERREAVHPGCNQIVTQPAKRRGIYLPVGAPRRDQVGKDALQPHPGPTRFAA